jgi:hypothetical protein
VGETGNAYRVLGGKSDGRSLLRRRRCRWKVIKMYLQVIGLEIMDWFNQESVLDFCEHGSKPLG